MRSKPTDYSLQTLKTSRLDRIVLSSILDERGLPDYVTPDIKHYNSIDPDNKIIQEEIERHSKKVTSFMMPIFSGDKETKIIHGNNFSIYRELINNNISYFDSFVPLRHFIYRKRVPWSYLDILGMSDEEEKRLVDFTNRDDNNFIGINRIESDFKTYLMIRMEMINKDIIPIVGETTSYTEESVSIKQAEKFNKISADKNKIKKIYDAYVDAINLLPKHTGYRLTDISLNNIFIGNDLDTIKISDFMDIRRARKKEIFDMAEMFLITRERLDDNFIKNLSQESLRFFPTYEEKTDSFKRKEIDSFIVNLFKNINRQRYIEIYY